MILYKNYFFSLQMVYNVRLNFIVKKLALLVYRENFHLLSVKI